MKYCFRGYLETGQYVHFLLQNALVSILTSWTYWLKMADCSVNILIEQFIHVL